MYLIFSPLSLPFLPPSADPHPQKGRAPSKRGVGFSFGPDYTQAFLEQNNLQLLIRSHEMQEEGYTIDHDGEC